MPAPLHGPPPLRVSHIVLDIDGTLVNFIGALRTALQATAEAMTGLTATAVTERQLWEARDRVAAEPEWAARGSGAIRGESFRRVLADAGAPRGVPVSELLAEYGRVRVGALTVFPDVVPALGGLQARGFSLIAASNGGVDLAPLALSRYFAVVQYAREAGVSKPDPRFFSAALERAGGRPETALAVGDRVEHDYEPARAAGLHAVLIDRRARVDDPAVHRIETLTELGALVEPVPVTPL